MDRSNQTESIRLRRERKNLVRRIGQVLDKPMTVLSFVWLGLMILEFTSGLSPALEAVNYFIWLAFVLHFALEFWIAPEKWQYLRGNWLTAFALLLPALRILRIFRFARIFQATRLSRGVRLVRWLTSLNRGMKATQQTMRRRGLRYVIALTVLVNFAGAAGIYLFENPRALIEAGDVETPGAGSGIRNYAEALWWTAMMLTTMGSDYFPKSTEGRIVALLLAVYAFAIFGYITATVASLIIRVDQDVANSEALAKRVESLQGEIAELKMLLKDRLTLDGESPQPS